EGGVPLDPWNRPYLYSDRPSAEQPFTLYSQGADGQPGGKGLDADVGYAPKR
ncbi:type II secretion system protein GspG, partial [Listeria monocytogenes]|nr:type II secretion system protein GspG [Listeria monocytogenes]